MKELLKDFGIKEPYITYEIHENEFVTILSKGKNIPFLSSKFNIYFFTKESLKNAIINPKYIILDTILLSFYKNENTKVFEDLGINIDFIKNNINKFIKLSNYEWHRVPKDKESISNRDIKIIKTSAYKAFRRLFMLEYIILNKETVNHSEFLKNLEIIYKTEKHKKLFMQIRKELKER